jgi:hypothetical protein
MKKNYSLILGLISILLIGCGKNPVQVGVKESSSPKSYFVTGGRYHTNALTDSTGQFLVGFVSDTTLQFVRVQTNLSSGGTVKVLPTYNGVMEFPAEDGLNHIVVFDETHSVKHGETYYSLYYYNSLLELNSLIKNVNTSSLEISL